MISDPLFKFVRTIFYLLISQLSRSAQSAYRSQNFFKLNNVMRHKCQRQSDKLTRTHAYNHCSARWTFSMVAFSLSLPSYFKARLCFCLQGRQSHEDVVSSKSCGRSLRIGHVLLRVSRPPSKADFQMSLLSMTVIRLMMIQTMRTMRHGTISYEPEILRVTKIPRGSFKEMLS